MKAQAQTIPLAPEGGSEHAAIMEQVRSWRAVIERNADENEQSDCLGAEVRELLETSNILNMHVPRVVGGIEAHPQLSIDVVRELSYYDGSTGWYAGASMTGSAVAGAFLGDRAVEQVFAKGAPRCAGQVAPTGKAEKVGDHYRIAGTYAFGSGIPSANWVIGGFVLHRNGVAQKTEAGIPHMVIAFVPRPKVEILGNWDVIGLRGTASYDYRIPEQLVHEDFVLDISDVEHLEPQRGGPLYHMGGFRALACIHHGSVALGCSFRALDEWVDFAKTKSSLISGVLNQQHTTQHALATSYGEMRAMESFLRGSMSALYDAACAGEIPDQLKINARLAASVGTAVGVKVTQLAFNSCTTRALRNGSRLQRAYRDMQAASAHTFTGETSLIQLGAYLAGAPNTHISHYL